ncbi:MAG: hypothetical protein XD51_0882 [Moorella sp. 60_41]|nr:MAG: hypothetical protein XD51_0882 [Moorella sp. 60_41]
MDSRPEVSPPFSLLWLTLAKASLAGQTSARPQAPADFPANSTSCLSCRPQGFMPSGPPPLSASLSLATAKACSLAFKPKQAPRRKLGIPQILDLNYTPLFAGKKSMPPVRHRHGEGGNTVFTAKATPPPPEGAGENNIAGHPNRSSSLQPARPGTSGRGLRVPCGRRPAGEASRSPLPA